MKYLKALEQKGLELSSFPKTIQKKVDDLNNLKKELDEIKSMPEDRLDEDDLEALKEYQLAINELDNYLERKVNIFDPKKYEKKLEQLSVLAESKKSKSKGKVENKEEEVEEPIKAQVYQTINIDELKKFDGIDEKVEELKEEFVEIEAPILDNSTFTIEESYGGYIPKESNSAPLPPTQVEEEFEEEFEKQDLDGYEYGSYEDEEADEFEKVGNSKPKKMTWGFIALGLGFALMTFGAVNIMKNRRG